MSGARELPKWREDFPFETADDEFVTRRDFTRYLLLASGGFAVGNAVVLAESRIGRDAVTRRTLVARAGEEPAGSAAVFHYPDALTPALLVHRQDGTWAAFHQKCTHLGCPVAYQPGGERGGECLHCHCHNGEFDVRSGQGTSGPPRELRPLARITLEFEGDAIYATGVESRHG
jgi:nitrite reductase/ring-hydroxylating ferredoxin subunit